MKKIKLTIQGMYCASCASNIERSLRKISGVKEVSVSLMMKKGIVEAEDIENPADCVTFCAGFSNRYSRKQRSSINGNVYNVTEEDLKKAAARTGYKVINLEKA